MDAVLARAVPVFREHGYDGASIDHLRQAAGLTAGSLAEQMGVVAREAAQRRAGFRLDRRLHAARDPGYGTLEEGGAVGVLLDEPDQLAAGPDRAEAQDRDVDQQEILVAPRVVREQTLSVDADHRDRMPRGAGMVSE
ncbi:hypothetical protein [Methylobacterium sp. sgz302541]|uniref:hypothetical protein n=1 Tax=unclassified Methylobacterium TaxID=2615210 RepID=UPI003D3560D8